MTDDLDDRGTGSHNSVPELACRSCRGTDDRARGRLGPRLAPAGIGAFAGLALLVLMVLALGPLLDRIPLHLLQLVIGVLLLLFGMRWLRKAILRAAGAIALHDEAIAFATETEELRDQARRHEARLDWLAGLASFKAVVLEGLEVVFIVIAVGAGRGLLGAASLGALAACLVVVAVGFSYIVRSRGCPRTRSSLRRSHAFSIRGILDRRRARRPMAGRGLCYPSVCGSVPDGRACRCRPHASR